jgi:hypothetical protein
LLDALKWLFPQSKASQSELYSGKTHVSGKGVFPVKEVHAKYTEFWGSDEVNGLLPVDADDQDEEERLDDFRPSGRRRGAELVLRIVPRYPQMTLFGEADEPTETFQIWDGERFTYRRTPSGPSLPVYTITPFTHRVEQIQISQLSEIILERMQEGRGGVLDLIHMLDPDVRSLEILSRQGIRPTLYIQHDQVGLAPLSAFGDGVRRTLMMALALYSVTGGVLLIDEIETSIHISALGQIFEWLTKASAKQDVQLFATTHSLEAVDAMLKATAIGTDDIVVYRLDASGKPARRFSGDLLHRLRFERGLDVR